MVFDILHTAEHGDLTDLPYTERREILRKFVKSGKQVQVPDNLGVKLNNAMEVSEELVVKAFRQACSQHVQAGQAL